MKGWIPLISKGTRFLCKEQNVHLSKIKRDVIQKAVSLTICSIILGDILKICFWKT